MRSGGEIGEREIGTRQPLPALGEVADIVQMAAQVGVSHPERPGIGLAAPGHPLHDLFAQQMARHVMIEAQIEPGDQPAHLHPLGQGAAKQRDIRIGLVQVFADGRRFGDDEAILIQQRGHRAGRVDFEEFRPALPGLFQPEFERQALLGQRQTDFAAEG